VPLQHLDVKCRTSAQDDDGVDALAHFTSGGLTTASLCATAAWVSIVFSNGQDDGGAGK
jgi:hypothetical protein